MSKMIFSLLFLFAGSAFAQNVELQLLPAQPLLVTDASVVKDAMGNDVTIPGPYFTVNLLIINKTSEDVILADQTLSITLPNGSAVSTKQPVGTTIPAGVAAQLQGYYSLAGVPDPMDIEGQFTVSGTSLSGAPFTASASFTLAAPAATPAP